MELLGINKLKKFWKYYKDFENMYDNRSGNMHKTILKEISEEEIEILIVLEENFMLLKTKEYAIELEKGFQDKINKYKNRVSEEVLEYMKKGEKPVVFEEKKKTWYNRIFKI